MTSLQSQTTQHMKGQKTATLPRAKKSMSLTPSLLPDVRIYISTVSLFMNVWVVSKGSHFLSFFFPFFSSSSTVWSVNLPFIGKKPNLLASLIWSTASTMLYAAVSHTNATFSVLLGGLPCPPALLWLHSCLTLSEADTASFPPHSGTTPTF